MDACTHVCYVNGGCSLCLETAILRELKSCFREFFADSPPCSFHFLSQRIAAFKSQRSARNFPTPAVQSQLFITGAVHHMHRPESQLFVRRAAPASSRNFPVPESTSPCNRSLRFRAAFADLSRKIAHVQSGKPPTNTHKHTYTGLAPHCSLTRL